MRDSGFGRVFRHPGVICLLLGVATLAASGKPEDATLLLAPP
jgi:hypothetical protein